DHSLKRALGAGNLVLLGIGAIIGAGIFVLTGQAAANYAGPAIVFSFILAGVACGFAGLCYAEFAAMIPISGSAYTYGYATLGEFVAWIIGWDLILAFIAFGMAYINRENWVPFIPAATDPGHFGIGGIARGAAVIFFAYIGFDAVSTAAKESKNPQKDMPIGILGSLAICTVLYITVALVLTGLVKYDQLNVPDPIAVGINAAGAGLAWLRPIVKIGAIAGLSSVILVMLLGQPRIFYTMSKDGLLPPLFAKVHPKFQTPWIASILTGVVAMLIAGFFPIGLLG